MQPRPSPRCSIPRAQPKPATRLYVRALHAVDVSPSNSEDATPKRRAPHHHLNSRTALLPAAADDSAPSIARRSAKGSFRGRLRRRQRRSGGGAVGGDGGGAGGSAGAPEPHAAAVDKRGGGGCAAKARYSGQKKRRGSTPLPQVAKPLLRWRLHPRGVSRRHQLHATCDRHGPEQLYPHPVKGCPQLQAVTSPPGLSFQTHPERRRGSYTDTRAWHAGPDSGGCTVASRPPE